MGMLSANTISHVAKQPASLYDDDAVETLQDTKNIGASQKEEKRRFNPDTNPVKKISCVCFLHISNYSEKCSQTWIRSLLAALCSHFRIQLYYYTMKGEKNWKKEIAAGVDSYANERWTFHLYPDYDLRYANGIVCVCVCVYARTCVCVGLFC